MKTNESQIFELDYYDTENGRSPLIEWLRALDNMTRAKVVTKIDKLGLGHFSNCKSVGDGLYELKMNFGPGYRVYYSRVGKKILLLISGGDKGSQKKDIKKAEEYLKDYRGRHAKAD